jgi:hypothetical protein
MTEPASAPSTETEAIALLRELGYTDDIELEVDRTPGVGGATLNCGRSQRSLPLDAVQVDHTFRFEGDSNPGDESIVLGLRFPGTDVRGVFVSAYGPNAEPETAAFFATLRNSQSL